MYENARVWVCQRERPETALLALTVSAWVVVAFASAGKEKGRAYAKRPWRAHTVADARVHESVRVNELEMKKERRKNQQQHPHSQNPPT